MSCDGISVVTMGCSIDSLDVCLGAQLADSRGDIGIIYAYELMHIFVLRFQKKLWSDSLLHVEGLLYDPIMISLLRDFALVKV